MGGEGESGGLNRKEDLLDHVGHFQFLGRCSIE
jgi:hypothetical protein